jgi:hypothetical protein
MNGESISQVAKDYHEFVNTEKARPASIEFYPHGAIIKAARKPMPRIKQSIFLGKTRGKVTTFSFASRRKLQETLLTLSYDKGIMISVTLTFPGVVIDDAQCQAAFDRWCLNSTKAGWCGIWRKEIQERGMLHFHVWLGVPYKPDVSFSFLHGVLRDSWNTAVEVIGEVARVRGNSQGSIATTNGFQEHGIEWEYKPDQKDADHFFAYSSAHSCKESQTAVGRGRHWGVFGRKQFTKTEPEKRILSEQEHAEILRVWNESTYPARKKRLAKLEKRLAKKYPEGLPEKETNLLRVKREALEGGIGGKGGVVRTFGLDLKAAADRVL